MVEDDVFTRRRMREERSTLAPLHSRYINYYREKMRAAERNATQKQRDQAATKHANEQGSMNALGGSIHDRYLNSLQKFGQRTDSNSQQQQQQQRSSSNGSLSSSSSSGQIENKGEVKTQQPQQPSNGPRRIPKKTDTQLASNNSTAPLLSSSSSSSSSSSAPPPPRAPDSQNVDAAKVTKHQLNRPTDSSCFSMLEIPWSIDSSTQAKSGK